MIAFGPVPSRRFGQSLGINNIPPHICSFCCVYCQVGRTTRMAIERESFYLPDAIFKEVKTRLDELRSTNEPVDYLSFVPDGEPTLDKNLGESIRLLKTLGVKIAVVTNATLLWDASVREDLAEVDWVSVKIDTVTSEVWKKINRPHGGLELPTILEGVIQFRKGFKGRLTTETMLLDGINDAPVQLRAVADYLKQLQPDAVYLSLPTRPPAELKVQPAKQDAIDTAVKVFKSTHLKIKCLFEENLSGYGHGCSLEEDILGIAAVHPMAEDALRQYIKEAKADWGLVDDLVRQKKIQVKDFSGKRFFQTLLKPTIK